MKCKNCGSQNLTVEQGYSDIFDESRLKCLNCGRIQEGDAKDEKPKRKPKPRT